ncbi:MAG: hypothetical protein K9M45_07125 [Kiritimatiellales bacterium]|nr:hypothetical protein [Kiritimatiellales bacterium]
MIAVVGLFSGCATSKMPARQRAELWGEPLPSITMLDTVAADKDAVYVYVSAPEGKMSADEQIAIEGAAAQLTDEGAAIGIFELLADSDDYRDAQESIATPCVLALRKGYGLNVVNGELTADGLIDALVGSSCGAGGCGPSGCGPSGCR